MTTSLKTSIAANYLSQFYVTVIGVALVPLYIQYMGAEAYGLVGFYATLQASFLLLDLGLTPTVAREAARFRGGALDAASYRQLVRALELVFLAVAVAGGTMLLALSGFVAQNWLKAKELPLPQLLTAVRLMAVVVALRWMCGLYRGVITGSERQVWLGGFNAVIATLRFVAILPLLVLVGATPKVFFTFQAVLAVIEFLSLRAYTKRLLPPMPVGAHVNWDWRPLKAVLKFCVSVAFTNSLWVLVTQTDRVLLSNMLSLKEYGYFILAVTGAGGITMIAEPIRMALLPRMTKLSAEGDEAGVFRLYHQSTQLMSLITIPATLVLGFFPLQVLMVWTGKPEISAIVAPVLMIYAIGNGLSSVTSVAYCLQYAKGDLRLHVIETPLFILVFLPALLISVGKYGLKAAGYAWLGTMALFFVGWLPLIHRRFLSGGHVSWLTHDVAPILGLNLAAVAVGYMAVANPYGWPQSRLGLGVAVMSIGLLTAGAGTIGSRFIRDAILKRWQIYAQSRVRA